MAFKIFIDQHLGNVFHFLIYAMLEWVMIIVLFIDGFLSFFSNEFAKLFELRNPCLLCTRIDHVLVHRDKNFYYNDSLCEVHKKDISSLAYCHIHKKLFDTKKMCETCLLSFATEKDSDCDRYKSLVGILNKEIDCFVEDDQRVYTNSLNRGGIGKCSCCGEPLNAKVHSKNYSRNNSISNGDHHKTRPQSNYCRSNSISGSFLQAPTTSPRISWKTEEGRNMELPHINLSEIKFVSDNGSKIPGDDTVPVGRKLSGSEGLKPITTQILPDFEGFDNDRTNTFSKGNKFFGIPLSDSAQPSPRKRTRRVTLDKLEFIQGITNDSSAINEVHGDSIVHHLKKQVCLDRKSLIELYMELDEERNASAIAANNAMAMITRLQAEKASVQMEALQYQRLMDEQAEYDQEALQVMKDALLKREEEIRVLESELEAFREKYGDIKKVGSEICEIDDDDYQQFNKSRSMSSSYSEKSDMGSLHKAYTNQENDNYFDGIHQNESALDFEGERSHLLSLLMDLEKKIIHPTKEESISSYSHPKHEATAVLTREVSMIRERLRSIEAASGFLKHAAMTLQKGHEGAQLLIEIAEHLRQLRNSMEMASKGSLS
ncbi:hypothetical protein LIER_18558 [Lithospermum erythrorhizon]|uniref:GTD-binding domain-containing protein n=1 Tax=Lithospermum erythrorhizon TaxID=34254 RepID=A0AAV3QIL9_LITER